MEKSQSLKNILEAIQNRKDLCLSEIEKIENSSLNKLQNEFFIDINDISLEDIKKLPLSNRKNVIKVIDFNPEDFDFNKEEGFNDLYVRVNDYIRLYNDRINNLNITASKCDYYKELLSKDDIKDLFVDLKDFHNFIDSLGINENEKLLAEKKIALNNIQADILDPEITQTVSVIYKEVLDYPEVKNAILKYIKDNKLKLNLDFIESYAKDISLECNKSPELVQNVMIAMLLGQEYKKYNSDSDSIHLTRMHRVLKEFKYDDMRAVIAEANRILNLEMINLVNRNIEYKDIIITNATSEEEFEELKQEKLLMIAQLIKKQVSEYEKSINHELKDDYKNVLIGLIDEYNSTNDLYYVKDKLR